MAQGSATGPSHLPLTLLVEGGDEQRVDCLLQYSPPQCCFKQRSVLFGTVPLNLSTTRSVQLKNTGKHHAYFTVRMERDCLSVAVCVHC